MGLEEVRKEIDQVDAQMKELFLQRLALSAKVAEQKKQTGSPVYTPEREKDVIKSRSQGVDAEYLPECQDFFGHMMQIGRLYQYSKLADQKDALRGLPKGEGEVVLEFSGGIGCEALSVCLGAAKTAGLTAVRILSEHGAVCQICFAGDFSKQLARAAVLQMLEENGNAELKGGKA